MKLLSKDGKRVFNLPDKLAQRLVDKGSFKAAEAIEVAPEEVIPEEISEEVMPEPVIEPKEEVIPQQVEELKHIGIQDIGVGDKLGDEGQPGIPGPIGKKTPAKKAVVRKANKPASRKAKK